MKHKFKVHHRVIYKNRVFVVSSLTRTTKEAYICPLNRRGPTLWVMLTDLLPLGYATIKRTRNGQFSYRLSSNNHETLVSSETVHSKQHPGKMIRFYFSDFQIIDKTK